MNIFRERKPHVSRTVIYYTELHATVALLKYDTVRDPSYYSEIHLNCWTKYASEKCGIPLARAHLY